MTIFYRGVIMVGITVEEYNEEVKTLTTELESVVANYDTLIKNAKSKDVSQMLISKRDEVIYYYERRINGLHQGVMPQEAVVE